MKQSTINKIQILYGSGDIDAGELLGILAAVDYVQKLVRTMPHDSYMLHEIKTEYGTMAFERLQEE